MDFDRALIIDPKNIWALLGQGDVNTWLQRPDDAVRAYEEALALDPFFDVARHRLIDLHTARARKFITKERWSSALAVLQTLLSPRVPDAWIPYHKEAYFLRSDIYRDAVEPGLVLTGM